MSSPHASAHTAATTQPDEATAKQLAAIQRKLDKWELLHLRAHAAEQAERLEKAEEDLERARADAANAWECADHWQSQLDNLIQDMRSTGREVGMTQSGDLLVMPAMQGVDIAAVHASRAPEAAVTYPFPTEMMDRLKSFASVASRFTAVHALRHCGLAVTPRNHEDVQYALKTLGCKAHDSGFFQYFRCPTESAERAA